MKLGYIARYRDRNGGYRFRFVECTYTVRISSRGKRVYCSKCFHPLDIEEVEDNTEIMKCDGLILVEEYTVAEIMEMTRNAYGGSAFAEFIRKNTEE